MSKQNKTGITAINKDLKPTSNIKDAFMLFFKMDLLAIKDGSDQPLSDTEVKARCEAIARKLSFHSDIQKSEKYERTLMAFRNANEEVSDIAIPEGC
jgi:hypothetical protein